MNPLAMKATVLAAESDSGHQGETEDEHGGGTAQEGEPALRRGGASVLAQQRNRVGS